MLTSDFTAGTCLLFLGLELERVVWPAMSNYSCQIGHVKIVWWYAPISINILESANCSVTGPKGRWILRLPSWLSCFLVCEQDYMHVSSLAINNTSTSPMPSDFCALFHSYIHTLASNKSQKWIIVMLYNIGEALLYFVLSVQHGVR